MTDAEMAHILDELIRMGAVGMDVPKCCAILGITEEEFYDSPEMQKSYRIGQYKGEYTWRQSVFKGAKEGVPQMCKIYQALIEKTVILNNPDLDMEEFYDCTIEAEERPDAADAAGTGGAAAAGEVAQSDAEAPADATGGVPS